MLLCTSGQPFLSDKRKIHPATKALIIPEKLVIMTNLQYMYYGLYTHPRQHGRHTFLCTIPHSLLLYELIWFPSSHIHWDFPCEASTTVNVCSSCTRTCLYFQLLSKCLSQYNTYHPYQTPELSLHPTSGRSSLLGAQTRHCLEWVTFVNCNPN